MIHFQTLGLIGRLAVPLRKRHFRLKVMKLNTGLLEVEVVPDLEDCSRLDLRFITRERERHSEKFALIRMLGGQDLIRKAQQGRRR